MRFFYVYYVYHQYTEEYDSVGDPVYNTKEIGLYTDKMKAAEAVKRFSRLEGFVNYPDGFHVERRRCYTNRDPLSRTGDCVFSPYHEYYVTSENYDVWTRGRFYAERDEALKELEEWKLDAVMKLYPEGFSVMEYVLDEDIRLWSEGFNRD